MNRGKFLIVTLIVSFSIQIASAQSRAYAKFDSRGMTIGLYNLISDTAVCRESRVISGRIIRVGYEKGDSVYSYSFAIRSGGKIRLVGLSFVEDEIRRPDAENLITKNRRVRVWTRPCGNGGILRAEEVRRL